jgi:lipopolysaccharide/colanic/teichoic acid biosynthesis glycosyltransferase
LAARLKPPKRPASAASAPWLGGRHLGRRVARVALLLSADLALHAVFSLVVQTIRTEPWFPPAFVEALDQLLPSDRMLGPQIPLVVIFSLTMLGAYGAVDPRRAVARRIMAAMLAVTLPAWPALWEGDPRLLAGSYLMLTALLAGALVAAHRLSEWLRTVMTPRRLRTAQVLLVAGERDIRRARRNPAVSDKHMFEIRGVFDPTELGKRGGLEAFCQEIRRCNADTVVLCCGPLSNRAFGAVVDAANSMGCGLVSLTRSRRGADAQPRLIWHRGSPLMELARPVSRTFQLLVKRVVDIAGAVVGLVLSGPLLAVIALGIRLESSGPILFGHRRIGAWGRPFRCLKFRTMRVDAEQLLRNNPVLHAQYVKNNYKLPEGEDPRITRVGLLLRKTSLDELPQFWNVLRGDMSLIGPRPVVPEELNEYGDKRRVLLSVKPGMSGAWAISGRSRVGYPHRAAIELGYVQRWRLKTDVSILWRTLPAVLFRRGAH